MKNVMSLDSVLWNKAAIVKEIKNVGTIRRRLLDIGLVPGTLVKKVLVSPAGDPKAYLIRGTMIAIRDCDAKDIVVEVM